MQAEIIEGQCGVEAITEMWHDHFSALLNSSPPTAVNFNSVVIEEQYVRFTPEEVISAIRSLKNGKSLGLDGRCADNLRIPLLMVLNSMLIHAHLPPKLMSTKISPIMKDKKGDLSSADNYRPIAITYILSKVFELMILEQHT